MNKVIPPQSPQQLAVVFDIARDLPAADRAIYLDRECSGNPELRRQIEQLLAHDQTNDEFLERPAWEEIRAEPRGDISDGALVGPQMEALLNQRVMHAFGGRNTGLESLHGSVLDQKYRIERLLGKGGMGAVYLATHLGTTRTVAVKVINPEYATIGEFITRFRREAAAAGRLRHPNIVNVTDFGVADVAGTQLAYLVMEYLDGETLGDHLKLHGRMPLYRVLDVVDQIALALDSAHTAGIVHRDLKPDNIWLESNRRGGYNVKVLDFGIAKVISGEQENQRGTVNPAPPCDLAAGLQSDQTITTFGELNQPGVTGELKTRFGTIVGTPAYMSPEQCLGMPVDHRADIYSLAVITYELVAGQVPFQGATVPELITQQIEAPVPSPHRFDAKISKPIAASIMRGLEKNPAGRPASAGALAALLRGVVEGEFAVLRKGKDTFQSYVSVFAPLWIAAFTPIVPLAAAAVLLLSHVSKARMVSDGWLIAGFYVVVLCSWFFCAQMFKAAAALMLLEVSSIGAFRPATTAVIRRLVKGFPDLVRTQVASLLDIRPASIWQNQLWPVAWAVEGLKGKEAVRRSQQLSRTVPDISLTLLPRFYVPALVAALLASTISAFVPGSHFRYAIIHGGPAFWVTIFYLFFASRLYVLYGTAFPFFYWFAALCHGESNMPALPESGAGRERSDSAKGRLSNLIWWLFPVLALLILIVRIATS